MSDENAKTPAPLELHDLTVSYHKRPVLWGVDVKVSSGQLVGIIGPNGAGKSTLIKAAMGMLPLNSGWVKIFGEPVEKNLRRVGYVPQRESVDWDFPVSGQQQRVFLARALAQESDLYFMDEPFAGVDAATESAIVSILQELREQGKTLLVVHHDLPTARDYFDSLLLLNMRVVAFGPTKEVFNQDLLQTTYGGRLTILSEVADAVGSKAS